MNHSVLEIAEVRIKKDVSEEDFIKAAENVHKNFLAKQAGLVSHHSYKSEEGTWIDLVRWNDKKSADDASQKAMQSEVCIPWFSMMDEKSITMRHVTLVKKW